MGTIPSYDPATTPLGNTDQIYLEQGSGVNRGKRATVQMLMDKFTPPVVALIGAEASRASASEFRLSGRDCRLSLYHFILSSISDPQPLGQLTGPAATITQASTVPVPIVLGDNSIVEPCSAWYETSQYRNPSVSVDPIIMTSGGFGMKTMAAALSVGTASAYATDSKFMVHWSQSLDRIVVATDGAHHNNAFGRLGLLLPEDVGTDVPEALPDELLIRISRAFPANVLDSFTLSIHRPMFTGNNSVVLPLSTLSSFNSGSTVAVRARRAAGGYAWKIDAWQES